MNSILSVESLLKSYKFHFWEPRRLLLNNVSLCLKEGEVVGLIGHNGAGKTTLFKMILGLGFPDSGVIRFSSEMGVEPLEKIGFLPESPYFYTHLTAIESLRFYSALFNVHNKPDCESDLKKLLLSTGLSEENHSKALGKFSKGMLQRFGMAQALVNDPKLIIFDEPMSGLDPGGRRDFRNIIKKLKSDGKTILFSTHLIDDVQRICDRVLLLHNGKIIGNTSIDVKGESAQWLIQYQDDNEVCTSLKFSNLKELNKFLKSPLFGDKFITHVEKNVGSLEEWIDNMKKQQEGM